MKDTTTAQEGKIAEFRARELRLQEEINALKDRPIMTSHVLCSETRETRWTVIKSMIDNMFKEVHDNWWTAVRPDINNFNEFKKLFKDKYWSEATQHMVCLLYTSRCV